MTAVLGRLEALDRVRGILIRARASRWTCTICSSKGWGAEADRGSVGPEVASVQPVRGQTHPDACLRRRGVFQHQPVGGGPHGADEGAFEH